jgi:L-lactate dehydrogenase
MKIGIVGRGFVGSTGAYALINQGIGREIVLVDVNAARAAAEADDLLHSVPFTNPIDVRAGDFKDLKGSKVVILAAGTNQQPHETRLQLLDKNVEIFEKIVPPVLENAPDAVLLVATNPVDVMTHFTASIASRNGVPAGRVLGTGTTLDTARFRSLLGNHLGVDSQHVHAYVLGEHGDSEVLTWSLVSIGGMPLDAFCRERNCGLDTARRSDTQSLPGKAPHIMASAPRWPESWKRFSATNAPYSRSVLP